MVFLVVYLKVKIYKKSFKFELLYKKCLIITITIMKEKGVLMLTEDIRMKDKK